MQQHSPAAQPQPRLGQQLGRLHVPLDTPSHGQAGLIGVVERIEQTVDAETAALRQFKAIDLREFNARKSQGLLELTRSLRSLGGGGLDAQTQARLQHLRAKLDANQMALATHLKAAREITTLVAETIQDSESDGTYSNVTPFRNAGPW